MKCRAFLPALVLLLLTACGKAELTGISLQPVTVQAGETAEAAVQYETAGKASDTAIQTAVDANHWTWQTGDESIATVNSQGVVTGLHGGETTLTLTDASGDLTASCTVQVTNPLRELILNDIVLYLDERTEIVLDYDGTERISHYPSSHASILCRFVPEDATGREPVTYQIADESIAKLDGQWLVPVAYGTTTLTATCSGKTATATVTVVRIPEEIHLNIKEIRLKPGETVQLSAEFEPADADPGRCHRRRKRPGNRGRPRIHLHPGDLHPERLPGRVLRRHGGERGIILIKRGLHHTRCISLFYV